jgi:hypothetical protein
VLFTLNSFHIVLMNILFTSKQPAKSKIGVKFASEVTSLKAYVLVCSRVTARRFISLPIRLARGHLREHARVRCTSEKVRTTSRVSCALAADVASAASTASATKFSKLDSLIPGNVLSRSYRCGRGRARVALAADALVVAVPISWNEHCCSASPGGGTDGRSDRHHETLRATRLESLFD